MENNNASILQKQLNDFNLQTANMLKEIGDLNKKEADKSFNTKSYDGRAWEDSKEHKNELLVKTGKLKGSIKVSSNGKDSVKVTSDVSYAVYHNEGTNRLPRRQFIGNSITVEKGVIEIIKTKIKTIFK